MSMQRVLETARKLGLPVIVTDPAGREPFVLLPLDQFEAMAGESKVSAQGGSPPKADAPREHASDGESRKLKVDGGVQFIAPEIPLNVAKNNVEDIPLEDRFYLEPAGDETMP